VPPPQGSPWFTFFLSLPLLLARRTTCNFVGDCDLHPPAFLEDGGLTRPLILPPGDLDIGITPPSPWWCSVPDQHGPYDPIVTRCPGEGGPESLRMTPSLTFFFLTLFSYLSPFISFSIALFGLGPFQHRLDRGRVLPDLICLLPHSTPPTGPPRFTLALSFIFSVFQTTSTKDWWFQDSLLHPRPPICSPFHRQPSYHA